jgi:hypothetical protein
LRIPADQFERGRLDMIRTAELRDKLLERAAEKPSVSDEELDEEVLARRRSSDGGVDQPS